jgi:uncharacterized protein (DUF1800 family)
MKWVLRLLVSLVSIAAICSSQAQGLSQEQRALHVLNRLGYGARPGDLPTVIGMGPERYIDQQLNPDSLQLPPSLLQRLKNLQVVNAPAGEVLAELVSAQRAAKQGDVASKQKLRETVQRIAEQTAQARMLRAIESPRQLEEVMVDFWFNHFNVFSGKGLDRALIASYERDAIRPYALGRFRDMLGATAKHPAMLFYLDNWLSAAPGFQASGFRQQGPAAKAGGLNENYARELMELHTLGVDGGYSQKDVTELARILTGWTFLPREMVRDGYTFHFEPRRHDQGTKNWLGYTVLTSGQTEGEWALDILAASPVTARHISYQLAQYFVADQPAPVLVERLAKRFLDTRGDIRAVLHTLFDSPEFWDSANVGTKFKTPYQYIMSAVRAADISIVNVRPLMGVLAQLGMPLYGCQTPDGYKNTEAAWLNPEALTRRITFATALASGRLPLDRVPDPGAARGMGKQPGAMPPLDVDQLMATLGASIADPTRQTMASSRPALRAALLLGSPDFMRH